MSIDTELATALHARLTEVIDDAISKLPRGMEQKEYQQSCGMIVAWRMTRDDLLPLLIEEIQKR